MYIPNNRNINNAPEELAESAVDLVVLIRAFLTLTTLINLKLNLRIRSALKSCCALPNRLQLMDKVIRNYHFD